MAGVLRHPLHHVDLTGSFAATGLEQKCGNGEARNRETGTHGVRHCTETGARLPHAIVSFMPLAIGPHAVLCAVSVASAAVWPAAVAQLLRPLNSMQTVHCSVARAVDM